MVGQHENELDDEYYIPLTDQRVFGAGLNRKRVTFVPASSEESSIASTDKSTHAGNRYLSIVMQRKQESTGNESETNESDTSDKEMVLPVCPVCGQSVPEVGMTERDSHYTSIAHQLSLQHSHPPSHLDRSRAGLKYLQDHGWDPDSRQGLGARQEGIRIPIKAKEKNDSAGLGALSKHEDEDVTFKQRKQKLEEHQVRKLNAKEVRRIEEEKSSRAVELRESVYVDDLVSRYIGSNG